MQVQAHANFKAQTLLIETTGPSQVFNALWRSFEAEFAPHEAEIKRCSKVVEEEILLAKAQADYQDQQLQLREREAASDARKSWRSFITKTSSDTEESREWRIRRDARAASKCQREVS